MQHSGGDIDLAAQIGGEGVAVNEMTRKRFGRGEARGFANEGGIEIDAGEFDAFSCQGSSRGEPANGVADAAANVNDTDRAVEAFGTHGGDRCAQQVEDAMAMVELLGQPLHFPVNRQHESVDGERIEEALTVGNLFDDMKRLAIAGCLKRFADFLFGNRETLQRFRVVLDDEVGNLRLRWIPGEEHRTRVDEIGMRE